MTDLRGQLAAPYWAADEGEKLPGYDFNREIIAPGANETFPDGAVGIRVDDDFWAVAALPLSFRSMPLPEVVSALWPEFRHRAQYRADSGTPQQDAEFARREVAMLTRERDWLETKVRQLERALRHAAPTARAALQKAAQS